ncbi:twin-arginine translocation signal domain-containing protein [Mangrovibacterium sp.]
MTANRRDFLKKACIAGGCLCGFSSLAGQNVSGAETVADDEARREMMQK